MSPTTLVGSACVPSGTQKLQQPPTGRQQLQLVWKATTPQHA